MATQIIEGQTTWNRSDDVEGYKTYTITFQTIGDPDDGPNAHSLTEDLPQTGDHWSFESVPDDWSFCTAERDIKQRASKGPNTIFDHTFKFTNKPPDSQRCQDVQIENPLLEPMTISGGFTKFTEQGILDRFGIPIQSSSWEPIRGKQNEWDANRPNVKVGQNVPLLELELLSWLIDCVNDRPLWGLPARCIKFTSATWTLKYYGQCFRYFNREMEFDINRKGWDRDIQDIGTKFLNGEWTANHHWKLKDVNGERPNRFNPAHFIEAVDFNGNPLGSGVLNGFGLPAGVCIDGLPEDPADVNPVDVFIYNGGPTGDQVAMGKKTDNTDYWCLYLPVVDGEVLGTPTIWNAVTKYVRGNVVTRLGQIYLCLATNLKDDPTTSQGNWRILTLGLNDEGVYNNGTLYTIGSYVSESSFSGTGTGPCNKTTIGHKLVQKYFGANLLLLGIPAILPT